MVYIFYYLVFSYIFQSKVVQVKNGLIGMQNIHYIYQLPETTPDILKLTSRILKNYITKIPLIRTVFNMILTSLNRYQAFTSHLFISLVIFSGILICITQYWYPGLLFDTANGWRAISLIIGIDLILGPVLTLIVFNPKKSSLKFDLSIIAVIQIIALSYGCWTIHTSRPIALAFINNSFYTLYANADNSTDIQRKINELGTNQLFYVFNDLVHDKNLNAEQFQHYEQHAKSIPKLENSSYIYYSANRKNLFIQLDPSTSQNRYIRIDKRNGRILNFSSSVTN